MVVQGGSTVGRPKKQVSLSLKQRTAFAVFCALALAWAWASVVCAADPGPWIEAGDLARLEFEGRAQPAVVARDLENRLAQGDFPARGEQIQAWRLLGLMRSRLGQDDAADAALMRIEELANSKSSAQFERDAQVAAACLRADFTRTRGSLVKADAMVDEIVPFLDPRTPVPLHLSCLVVQASIKENLGRFDESVRLTQAALRLVERTQPWRRSSLLSNLAYTYYRAGQLDQALKFQQEAKGLALASQDWVSLSEASTIEGLVFSQQGMSQSAQALRAWQDAITYARRAGDAQDEALGLGNLSDLYLLQGDYSKALALAEDALRVAREAHAPLAERVATINRALSLIGLKRTEEGLALISELLDQLEQSDGVVTRAETLKETAVYLEKAGSLKKAVIYYTKYRAAAQDAYLQDQQRTLVELQETFETERRHHERSLLMDENQLKQETLRQNDLKFRLWGLAAAVSSMAVLLLILMHRRMRATHHVLHSSNEQLREQSEQDPLTGLSNRRHFQRRVMAQEEFAEAHGTLYLLDLDHFKHVNDTYGHAAGDAVLVEVARRLKQVLREEDLIIRWGGEEFVILVRGYDADGADLLAQRLLVAVGVDAVATGEVQIPISTSIGYATLPLQPNQVELKWPIAMDLVDAAMYVAKTQGRNRAVGVKRSSALDLEAVLRQVSDFESAWQAGELTLVEFNGPERS